MPPAEPSNLALTIAAIIAVLVVIAILLLLRRVAMWLFTLLIVIIGALLLLLAVFGQQLGLWSAPVPVVPQGNAAASAAPLGIEAQEAAEVAVPAPADQNTTADRE